MAITESVVGRLPIHRGPYNNSIAYARKNMVSMYNCEFESLIDENWYPPASLNDTRDGIIFDTEHWKVVSNGSDVYFLRGTINNLLSRIEALENKVGI